MKIAVGSKNPVKINAVKLAFEKVWPDETWEVVGEEVGSDVSDQPMSIGESITGAKNRARKVMKKIPADYSVGLEGGIFQEGELFFDGAWIVVRDTKGREGIGATVQDLLSEKMMKLIREGKELGDVDDILFNLSNSKQGDGHFGLMTRNLISRTDGYRDGVIIALSRFMHPQLFEE
jgi:inosine/xanthosine triphosphatase